MGLHACKKLLGSTCQQICEVKQAELIHKKGPAAMKALKIDAGRFLILATACAILNVVTFSAWESCTAQTLPANPPAVSADLQDIVKLSQAKISDNVIINYIKSSKKTYNLSANDIGYLEAQGMSQPVMKALEQTVSASAPPVQTSETSFSTAPTTPAPSQPAIPSSQGIRWQNEFDEHANAIVALCLIALVLVLLLAILGTVFGLKEKVIIYGGKCDLVLSFVVPALFILAFPDYGFDSSVSRTLKVVSLILLICSVLQSFVANRSIVKIIVVVPTKFILAGLLTLFALIAAGGVLGAIQRFQRNKRKEAMEQFAIGAAAAFGFHKLRKIVARLVR